MRRVSAHQGPIVERVPITIRRFASGALHGSGRDSSETRTQDSKKETIKFNDANVCDACLLAAKKRDGIDWSAREKQLLELLDKHRSKDGAAGLAFAPSLRRLQGCMLCVCALAGV